MPKWKRTRVERAASTIEQRLADGTYPDGARLPFGRLLALDLGVSHVTVYHAMAMLEEAGLITKASNRQGYYAGKGAPPGGPRPA